MTDQQIDFELALAIGYATDRVRIQTFWHKGDYRQLVQVLNDHSRMDGPMQYGFWQRFDHKDPAVVWPIAERFECFPKNMYPTERIKCPKYGASVLPDGFNPGMHDNPATAAALAVINHFESKA